jgi:hypothetical protein
MCFEAQTHHSLLRTPAPRARWGCLYSRTAEKGSSRKFIPSVLLPDNANTQQAV